MEISEKELVEIINEEVQDMIENDDIDEGVLDRLKAKTAGSLSSVGSAIAGKIPGGGAASAEMATNAKLKQAASVMSSYAQHMLKLRQKLEQDVTKLGLGDIADIKKVSQSIEQARALTQSTADRAPKDEKFRQAVQAAAAEMTGQQPAAEPTAKPPAATPAAKPAATPAAKPAATPAAKPAATPAAKPAATPAAAQPAAKPKRQLSQDPRNVRRRERRAAKKAAAEKERARKDARNAKDRARRAAARQAQQAAAAAPAAAANSAVNENETKKGKTLNEQLQKISKRWGFDK